MTTIYLSSLPFKTTEQDIRSLLEPFGTVGKIELRADWVNPTFEPYALAEVNATDIEALVFALDGKKIGRTFLRVHKKVELEMK